jgi:hypothetical protein
MMNYCFWPQIFFPANLQQQRVVRIIFARSLFHQKAVLCDITVFGKGVLGRKYLNIPSVVYTPTPFPGGVFFALAKILELAKPPLLFLGG